MVAPPLRGPLAPAFLLKRPEDPSNYGKTGLHLQGCSWQATSQCRDFASLCRMWTHTFDQCMLGHPSNKPTAVMTNLEVDWNGLRCDHQKHPQWFSSKALARWKWHMKLKIAQAGVLQPEKERIASFAPVHCSRSFVTVEVNHPWVDYSHMPDA